MVVANKKTGETYQVIDYCINATNAQESQEIVVYMDRRGKKYCRERQEFNDKFILK